jgi:hypothetical protein
VWDFVQLNGLIPHLNNITPVFVSQSNLAVTVSNGKQWFSPSPEPRCFGSTQQHEIRWLHQSGSVGMGEIKFHTSIPALYNLQQ